MKGQWTAFGRGSSGGCIVDDPPSHVGRLDGPVTVEGSGLDQLERPDVVCGQPMLAGAPNDMVLVPVTRAQG